ncbi:MAG: methionine adenosyltransferase [Candidatus Nanohalobium sp.]
MNKERINIEKTEDRVKNSKTEIVERKGLGHPDSISDGIAEKISRTLSRKYREKFGKVLHHNTDEVQLVAGESRPEIGGGEQEEKIYVLLTGRATKEHEGKEIDVDRIARNAAKEYIEENFKVLSPKHIEFESKIGETSSDLKNIFEGEKPRSNDTSFGVGHAPLSPTEKTVRRTEKQVRHIHEVGEDVKVMAVREERGLKLTVAAAVISSRINSIEEYKEVLQEVKKTSEKIAEDEGLEPEVHVNTADEDGEDSIYITETGTSAEMGDDGSVGRGNRVNGLITPGRPMSLEAASGKNPVSHVGKIYNLLAKEIARDIYENTGKFAEVKIVSQIGERVDRPQKISVNTEAPEEVVEDVVENRFSSISELTQAMIDEEHRTF